MKRIARSAALQDGHIVVAMESGAEIRFPVAENPRLNESQLNKIEISPFGLRWPELDEDLSFRGLLRGDFGQRPKQTSTQPP